MKALWFMPFTFAAGAEGFALFAPYLISVLTVLYFAKSYQRAPRPAPVRRVVQPVHQPTIALGDLQPAL
jgi:hypothetical protein